ncbi:MAG: hypothetical protein M3R04_08675 [bacterium]|nr:hypothetical protein [bacterium]
MALAVGLVWSTAAQAAVETYLDCPNIPGCCTFSCVLIDVDCNDDCGCACSAKGPLFVDFLDVDNRVLGSARFEGDWCCGQSEAILDQPVNSEDVCAVRVVKADEDCEICWMSLFVLCEDNCTCGKWKKVWKGEPCGWNQIVEEAPAPEPAPEPEPAPIPRPVPPPPPAPLPRPLPPPPAPEPEVIETPGFG